MAIGASSDVDSPDRHADGPKPIGFPLYDGIQQCILPFNFNRTVTRTKDAIRSGVSFHPSVQDKLTVEKEGSRPRPSFLARRGT